MGHYDDVFERQETEERQRAADAAGISYEEQWQREIHARKMREAERVYIRRKKEDEQIAYFLKHSKPAEAPAPEEDDSGSNFQ